MAFIKKIEINQLRAIKQLTISELSDINLIVGDNNSGKTTFLEAIQLLYTQPQLSGIRNIINRRTTLNSRSNNFYTSFIKLFNTNQEKDHLRITIGAESSEGQLQFELSGLEENINGEDALKLSKISPRQKFLYDRTPDSIPEIAKIFIGEVTTLQNENITKRDISCTSLDYNISKSNVEQKVYYISAFGHLRYDLLQNIVNNPEYKSLAINILKKFDESIEDICYTKADDGTFLETIITDTGVNMPFSVYGDGIKKMLYILNKLFDATDSILMIDEIETGLHKKYYDMLFPVVFALAKRLNVQLFITTHSNEAIDAILKYGDYENGIAGVDPIRVITFKKIEADSDREIVARNVTGRYVYDNKKAFEFEVRL